MDEWARFLADFKALNRRHDFEALIERYGLRREGNAAKPAANGTIGTTGVRVTLAIHDEGGAGPELSDMAELQADGRVAAQVMFAPPGWQEA